MTRRVSWREMQDALRRASERMSTQREIAAAVNERKRRMALGDKFKMLADRAREVPRALDERADVALGRLSAAEARGDRALGGIERVATDIERGIAETESAVNQLTNGAPE